MEKKIRLRPATLADAPTLLAIYAPYVTDSVITFEHELPSLAVFKTRTRNILANYPYYIALVDGVVAGYAYASTFRPRASYQWTVETTVYVHQEYHGLGIGSLLYSALENTLKTQGVVTMIACIAHPNPPSTAFHETMGFHKVGHFSNCGYKKGQWIDVVWMEKQINPYETNPKAVVPFPDLGKE